MSDPTTPGDTEPTGPAEGDAASEAAPESPPKPPPPADSETQPSAAQPEAAPAEKPAAVEAASEAGKEPETTADAGADSAPPAEPVAPSKPAEPSKSAEPAPDFGKALEAFERGKPAAAAAASKKIKSGAKVTGTVVSIGEDNVLLDIGARSEAAAEAKHFRKQDGTLSIAVGDKLDLFVIKTGEEIVLAPSIKAGKRSVALEQVREAHKSGAPIRGRVIAVNTGGLAVNISGVRAFCPMSQIEAGYCEDPSVYVGKALEFVVAEVKSGRGGVVLSRKKILARAAEESAQKVLAKLAVGDELDGKVTKLEGFGAFVDIGGVDGLVHISEIGHMRVGHPRDAVSVGDSVRVRVLKIGTGKDGRARISLSIKAAQPDPWQDIEKRYEKNARVRGEVVRIADFGAFVNLEPGIDGLVHVSEAAHQRVAHPKDVFSVGQVVEAIVLRVDAEKKRISLSVKAATEGPSEAPAPRRRSGKAPRPEREAPPKPRESDAPMTTMAIALRKAMKQAEREGRKSDD